MTGALPAVSWHIVWTAWSPRPAVLLVSVGLLVWYLRLARQLAAEWPRSRTWSWCVGIASFVWVGSGFPQVYDRSLYWMWTAQQLALLLVVPVLLMAGHPIALNSSRYGDRSRMNRLLGTGPVRLVSSPLVGPLLVPLVAAVLFFGPVPRWAVTVVPFGWLLPIALVVIGSAIALPLVTEDARASLAIGLMMAVGFLELLADAVPGIVLRLYSHPVTSYFDVRLAQPWSPTPLRDQQSAGGILWAVAELLDLPFLVLVFARWIRADAREAEAVDAALDAASSPATDPAEADETSKPWWLTDPQLRDRYRNT